MSITNFDEVLEEIKRLEEYRILHFTQECYEVLEIVDGPLVMKKIVDLKIENLSIEDICNAIDAIHNYIDFESCSELSYEENEESREWRINEFHPLHERFHLNIVLNRVKSCKELMKKTSTFF